MSEKNSPRRVFFACAGEFWTIGSADRTFSLADIKGLGYLQSLLRHPRVEFHSVDLLRGPAATSSQSAQLERDALESHLVIRPVAEDDGGVMLDVQAKREYRQKLIELNEELAELRKQGNYRRGEQIEAEIDFLRSEITRAQGINRRDRKTGSASERARISVTRAIKLALDKISEHDRELGALLLRTIRTGAFCSYAPDLQTEVDWRFSLESGPVASATEAPVAPSLTRNATLLRSLAQRTTFVGRAEEREILARLLGHAHERTGRVALISGQAGVGKSRIAAEVAEEALRKGFVVLSGASFDREDAVPFGPFVNVLEGAMAQAPNPQTFRAALGHNAAELARLMPQLRNLFPEIPTPQELPPEQARRVLFDAIGQTLARTADDRPVLLLLDDLHWADEESLLLLASLARLIKTLPVLIIGTFRDFEVEPAGPLSAAIDELVRIRMVELIHLEGLSRSGVGEMLRALSDRPPPAKLTNLIYSETEGNPFFVEELFWYLSERGRLFDAAGNFRDLQIVEGDIPPTVRLVVGRRFARLSNDTRKALAAAAVIGRSFTFDLLAAATSMEAVPLLDSLEEAERSGLIYSGVQYPDIRFGFTHELIRQVVIGELSPQRHRMLHLAIADAIARVFSDTIEAHAEDLAQHLWQAGTSADPAKTIQYLTLAAKRAREQGSYEVVCRHLNNALESFRYLPANAKQPRLELELMLALSAALIATKGYAAMELEAPITRMLELCEKIDDQMLAFTVRVQIWANVSVRGDHDPGALQLSDRLTAMADDPPHPMIGLWSNVVRGISLFHTGQFLPARKHLERALELYDPEIAVSPGGFESPRSPRSFVPRAGLVVSRLSGRGIEARRGRGGASETGRRSSWRRACLLLHRGHSVVAARTTSRNRRLQSGD